MLQATFYHHLPITDSVVYYIKVGPTQAKTIPHLAIRSGKWL